MPAVTIDDIDGPDPIDVAHRKHKITADYLTRKLKQELNAKNTENMKFKGAIDQKSLRKGYKIIGTSGVILRDNEGNVVAGDGETQVEYHVIDWGTRQRARMDAHEQRGDYPAKKLEHSGRLDIIPQIAPDDRELLENISSGFIDAIIRQHRQTIKAGN